jgi:hypothetical protein
MEKGFFSMLSRENSNKKGENAHLYLGMPTPYNNQPFIAKKYMKISWIYNVL